MISTVVVRIVIKGQRVHDGRQQRTAHLWSQGHKFAYYAAGVDSAIFIIVAKSGLEQCQNRLRALIVRSREKCCAERVRWPNVHKRRLRMSARPASNWANVILPRNDLLD